MSRRLDMKTSEKQSTIFPIVLGRNNLIEQFLLLQVISKFLETRLERGRLMKLLEEFTESAKETKGFGRERMTINVVDSEYSRVGPHFVSV